LKYNSYLFTFSKPRQCKGGYNLGYICMWWSRMEREATKECMENTRRMEDRKCSTTLRKMLTKETNINQNPPTVRKSDRQDTMTTARDSSNMSDVLKEHRQGGSSVTCSRALERNSTLCGGTGATREHLLGVTDWISPARGKETQTMFKTILV
jgi:hypothetical protein